MSVDSTEVIALYRLGMLETKITAFLHKTNKPDNETFLKNNFYFFFFFNTGVPPGDSARHQKVSHIKVNN